MLISPEVFKVIWPSLLLNHRQEMINVLLMRPLHFIAHSPSCRIALALKRCQLCLHMLLKAPLNPTNAVHRKKKSTCIAYMLRTTVRKLKSNTQSHCSTNAPFFKGPTNLRKSRWNSTLSAFVDIMIIFLAGALFFFFFFNCLFHLSKR